MDVLELETNGLVALVLGPRDALDPPRPKDSAGDKVSRTRNTSHLLSLFDLDVLKAPLAGYTRP